MHVDADQLRIQIETHQSALHAWRQWRRQHPYSRRPRPIIGEPLARNLMTIAEGLCSRADLASHFLRDDLCSTALQHLVVAVAKYDARRGSAFSFVTRCAWFSICKSLRSDNRYRAMLQRLERVSRSCGLITSDTADDEPPHNAYFPSQSSVRT
jgi:hypothetical protein